MLDIIIQAISFVAIIALGYILKRIGWFKESDFSVLSTIVMKITLPAAIIMSFNGSTIDLSMLLLVVLGLGCGIVLMVIGYGINFRKSRGEKAFAVLNMPGYNIGNFTMPFALSFLGPTGVIATSLFDTGNAVVCLGGAYGIAALVKEGSGFSLKRILGLLVRSIPFMCYIVMVILCLLHLSLPTPVTSFLGVLADANVFLAMLMIGIGLELKADTKKLRTIIKILSIRYGIGILFALAFYYLLSVPMEAKLALIIMVFSPPSTCMPAFTEELKEDVGLSGAINSISTVISVVIIIAILSVML